MSDSKSFADARSQAAEFLGFAASERISTDSGVFEIPNPSLLDDDQQQRYDKLQLEVESWDRDEDGDLKEPYRKDGQLVESYNVQLAKALFGSKFKDFKAAGGRSSDVALIWWRMRKELADRSRRDSKSAGGPGAVAALPDGDRSGAEPDAPASDS